MDEHTKAVLEACTGQLVALGMTRQRRGLAVWQMNDEMWGGIAMQVRLHGSGMVRVIPVLQIVWEPVEMIVACVRGLGYRPWGPASVTRSRLKLPSREIGPVEFRNPEVDGRVLDRFAQLSKKELVPAILDLADERHILQFFREGAGRGGGRAEHVLAIRAWQTRSLDVVEEYGRLLTLQTENDHRSRLEAFQSRLTASAEVQAILTAH
ncbi:hypothetical protein [Maritimibacter sp. DP1N21-5]|uniref:hypothetical protein n=1 Tax=Maritimibacter sp. DP1N21-5 TaxID=2836867 RepID=UPI001C456ACC|nr:hypothetical protein [Maritimibacter sp. DP1N21-5]MBV7409875.1 hypothetical protein [Maritimibacter sp. DP1N21-5]